MFGTGSRTDKSRRLTGAFLGGMAGILTFGCMKAWSPIGGTLLGGVAVLIGVLLGYWYGEILHGFRSASREAAGLGREVKWSFKSKAGKMQKAVMTELKSTELWMNFANTSAYAIFILANVVLAGLAIYGTIRLATGMASRCGQDFEVMIWVAAIALMACECVAFGFLVYGSCNITMGFIEDGGGDSTEEWEKSRSRFMLRRIGLAFYGEALTVFFLTILASFWVGLGGLFVTIIVVPSLFIVGCMKVMLATLGSKGHWLCLEVTFGVTATSAYLFYDLLGDNTVALWMVALCNGALSAICVEWAHSKLYNPAWWAKFEKKASLAMWLAPAKENFMDVWDRFGRWFEKAMEKHLPMPVRRERYES